jgi:hypothetical protein
MHGSTTQVLEFTACRSAFHNTRCRPPGYRDDVLSRAAVAEAVEELYRTFAGYPLNAVTNVCWHCHSEEEERELQT